MEALGKKIAAYLLKVLATVDSKRMVVGSSAKTSSPTSALLMAWSIACGAFDRTSLLKSIS
jgi:hypothetical protein